jgi:tRNA-splicing ligase RtcB (3'-phosphate/5'-hydroxy nucleic acid ligase)
MKWVRKEDDQRVPIKSWCEDIDEDALQQAINLSIHPIVFRHIALMPDCHLGYGMPIGGVIACIKAIIPNAVGSDIGCGMCALRTDYLAENITTEHVKRIMQIVKDTVPVGFEHHKVNQEWEGFNSAPDLPIVQQHLESARKQLGTLGGGNGGNHFIEIQRGEDGYVWLMIHTGSRNFGFKIAKEYHKQALILCKRWFSNIPDNDLAFLPIEDQIAKDYFECMNFALKFAQENRHVIMQRFKEAVHEVLHCPLPDEQINIHHNYASWESHFNRNVIVHRKGATSARLGEMGIIPGSMGTPSYIVEGLGNTESFESCSHGAGRRMGKRKASKTLKQEDCDKAMEGIVFDQWTRNEAGMLNLSEAPQAYKDIDTVIQAQLDLIKPIVKLYPLGVVKG